jgi:hypothetical protein
VSSAPKHGDRDQDVRKGWVLFRRQVALMLMFCGAVALFALALDQVFEFQRPTNPLAALTLGPALIAAGYLLDRGALRFLLSGGREPQDPPTP